MQRSIPQELRDRVVITDHGVVDQVDPKTGETYQAYVMSYAVQHEGLEHGLTLASTPLLVDLPDAHAAAIELGVYGVLARAGFVP